MSSRSKEGEYGTGHNSYIMDEDGLVCNAYHGKPGVDGPRSSGLRRYISERTVIRFWI